MTDFLRMDDLLQEDEKLIRDTVKRFVQTETLDLWPEAYESGEFPRALIPKLAELGLLGMTLPEQYGGSEANSVMYGLVCQELEYGDSGLRSFVSVQSSLCMYPIFRYGSEAQKQKFLPAMSRGEIIGCFGLTEPDAGSDPGSMKTTAKKVSGGWNLNGSKMWITNGPIADIAIIWAKTDEGIRGFIVETKTKGFECKEVKMKASLRASSTGEIALSDCFVPDENRLPDANSLGAPLGCLNQARYGIAWGTIGAAMACYECALAYTKERKQFNKPLASFQLVQKDLVDMLTEITKSQFFNLQLGRLKDKNQVKPEMISMGKMNGCRVALDTARKARNLLGGNGISLEYPVIRHMANLESVFTYEGTDNVHHLIVGKSIASIDAFDGS